jgi:hypothetical protein
MDLAKQRTNGMLSVPYLTGVPLQPALCELVNTYHPPLSGGFQAAGPLSLGVIYLGIDPSTLCVFRFGSQGSCLPTLLPGLRRERLLDFAAKVQSSAPSSTERILPLLWLATRVCERRGL